MNRLLSLDFFEFGLSGRIYHREETLSIPLQEINARLPLKDFSVYVVDTNVFLVTYVSEVMYDKLEMGNRSSLWLKNTCGLEIKVPPRNSNRPIGVSGVLGPASNRTHHA